MTASHNLLDYNGLKLVKQDARPVSGDTGLNDIKAIAETQSFKAIAKRGTLTQKNILHDFVQHSMTYVSLTRLKPLKLVVNAGNGAAGHVIDAIEQLFKTQNVPITFVKVHHEPNPYFQNGILNPLLPENRSATANAVIAHQADMGIAWNGDVDRCFLFDESGVFIEGYYIVGLLAAAFLAKHPNKNHSCPTPYLEHGGYCAQYAR